MDAGIRIRNEAHMGQPATLSKNPLMDKQP
jgi:hypothetical protein